MTEIRFGTFSLDVPEGWTFSSVILSGPVEDSVAPSIPTIKAVPSFQRNLITTLERVPDEETCQSYVNRQVKGLRTAHVSWEEAAKPIEVELKNGLSALLLEQVIIGQGGERVRQMQLVFIKDNIAHTAIASQLDGPPFETVRDEFKKMLLSYQLAD